jgi:uncharacterized protein
MGPRHLARLTRARDLLTAKKYDTRSTTLTCYSAAGFDSELRDIARRQPGRVLLIGPTELYSSPSQQP